MAYWVGGLLLAIYWTFAPLLTSAVDPTQAWLAFALLGIAVLVTGLFLQVWYIVGAWRSADKHVGRGGSQIWAAAAKVVLGFGILAFGAAVAFNYVPMIGGFAGIIAESSSPNFTVRILRDAKELELGGFLSFGVSEEVEKALELHPAIEIVVINSEGGRIAEARRLSKAIAGRSLSTASTRACLSACTLVFASGERRVMGTGARFGFHSPGFPGVESYEVERENLKDRQFLESRGIDRGFISRAYEAENQDMWYPTESELLQSGFVSDIADADEISIAGIVGSNAKEIEMELMAVPVYAALKKYEPDRYKEIAAAMLTASRQGRSLADLRAETMPILMAVYNKRVKSASAEAIVNMLQVLNEQIQIVEGLGGRECVAWLNTGEGGVTTKDPRQVFPGDVGRRELEAMANIITSAAENPVSDQDSASLDGYLSPGLELLAAQYGEDLRLFSEVAVTDQEMQIKCSMYRTFFHWLTTIPKMQAAAIFRAMAAEAG